MKKSGPAANAYYSDLREAAGAEPAAVIARAQSSAQGLAWSEAQRRLETSGPNEIASQRPPAWPVTLWHSARNLFNAILLFLGLVSYFTGDNAGATVMGVMILVSTMLQFTQERKSLVQADSLRKLVRNKITVLRQENATVERTPNALDRAASDIPLEELVPGDIVKLSAGDMIPGDLLLLESRDLFVSQSALTGEAMPVEKFAGARRAGDTAAGDTQLDQPNLCFMGSSIVSGTGKALVLATGRGTFFGAMASKLTGRRPPTAFDKGVKKVSWLLVKFMIVMVPVVFLLNGLIKHDWMDSFFFAIAVAVGLTPEMLPMIVNANLARGAVSMSRRKTIVKRLNAIQNFGAMDVLCTDKTGTLTQDKVALIKYLDLHGETSKRVLEHAYLNSLFQTGLKNLIDIAVINRAHEQGLRDTGKAYLKVDEIPFDFSRRRMSVVLAHGGATNLLICKGAVEEMLEICTQVSDGARAVPIADKLRQRLKALRDELNSDGLRVIAVGYRDVPASGPPLGVADECDLVFSGFIAFLDPPKESTAPALKLLREHGVAVKILTGDNPVVAAKICRDVGLDVAHVATGAEVEPLDEPALADLAARTTIFAKLSPAQKARVVRALKTRGHTVGFMGDGINDATALREADVGISVDTAVDIAKEAADIILLEKSLLVLEQGVIEGRRTFGNIVKYIKMAASGNFGNVFSVLIASAFLPFLPMLAIQILVQNLLYDLSQVSIPWDRMDEDFIRKPRQWGAGSIATFMLWMGPLSSVFDVLTFLVMWYFYKANGSTEHSIMLFQSAWFVEGLITQTLIVHMIRTEKIPFIESTASLPVIGLTSVIVAIGIYLPFSFAASSLKMVALPPSYFLFLAGCVVGYCILTQVAKKLYIRKYGVWL